MLPPTPRCSSTYQVNFTPPRTTDNHVGNQSRKSHPCPTEGDGRIYSHRRSTNGYRHHQHPTTTIARLNEDKIWWAYFNTQPLHFILPTERYEHIYSKGAYSTPPVIALYDDTIDRGATRIEVHQAKGKHEARRNDYALYETSNTACNNFII